MEVLLMRMIVRMINIYIYIDMDVEMDMDIDIGMDMDMDIDIGMDMDIDGYHYGGRLGMDTRHDPLYTNLHKYHSNYQRGMIYDYPFHYCNSFENGQE
jgi:hypothetical protein